MISFSTTIIVIATIIPTICWMVFYYRQDKKDPEPVSVLWKTFSHGMIATGILLTLQWLSIRQSGITIIEKLETRHLSDLGITFVLALLEEGVKSGILFTLMLRNKKSVNQWVDGIIYGVSVGLGFSFIENIVYFLQVLQFVSRNEFILTYLFRTLGTMFAHTLFSGIVGYFIAYAILDHHTEKNIIKKGIGVYFHPLHFIRELITFHTLFHHILSNKPSEKGHFLFGFLAEAVFLSTILHFMFNLLLSTNLFDKNLMFLTVPFLFLLGSWVFTRFKDKQAIEIRND